VHVIRGSGVDTRRFDPGATPAPEPPVKVIVVSRLLREKGIEELVEAARLLRSRGVQARFLVAGDLDPGNPSSFAGPDLERWRLEGVVEFLGHRDDVPELLRAAHIACLPSWREGTPRSLLEAMACGLPIVTTDVPGCREVARNGDNAVLVAPRNPAALAEGLRTLIESPDLRAQMGRRSRQRACTEFSQEQVLERTLAIYSAAMA
jgi:glycosyltransferase involved in cell wall biosynthesis